MQFWVVFRVWVFLEGLVLPTICTTVQFVPRERFPLHFFPNSHFWVLFFSPHKDGFQWDDRSNSCFLFIPAPLPHPPWPSKLRPLQPVTQHPSHPPALTERLKWKPRRDAVQMVHHKETSSPSDHPSHQKAWAGWLGTGCSRGGWSTFLLWEAGSVLPGKARGAPSQPTSRSHSWSCNLLCFRSPGSERWEGPFLCFS